MKSIITLAILFTAITAASAQSPAGAVPALQPAAQTSTSDSKPAATPADKPATAATDDCANYVGTNDFYMALVHEGVRKA